MKNLIIWLIILWFLGLPPVHDWLEWKWFCFRWGPVHDFFTEIRKGMAEVGEEMVKLGETMIEDSEEG